MRDDTRFAAGKVAVFQYFTVVVFLFLISGFWKLQVQNPQYYDDRAQQNRIKSVPILAPRGRILDRDGRVIVDNHASFSLILARESLKEEHLWPIAQGLDLDLSDLQARVARLRAQPKYVPIVLKEELTPADLAFVDSHRDFFPELVLIAAQRRLYPQNGMMAHVIGYTGEISEQELDMPEFHFAACFVVMGASQAVLLDDRVLVCFRYFNANKHLKYWLKFVIMPVLEETWKTTQKTEGLGRAKPGCLSLVLGNEAN